MTDTNNDFRNLVEMLDHSVARHADRPLFGTRTSSGWIWMTYREFGALVRQLHSGLHVTGYRPGEVLAMISSNGIELAACAHAAMRNGMTFVPMYEQQSDDDWEHILRDCGANILIVRDEGAVLRIARRSNRLPKLRQIVPLTNYTMRTNFKYADLLDCGQCVQLPPIQTNRNDPACIIYTSGTTGKPKGVMLSHDNLRHNILAVRKMFDFGPTDRSLAFLPWAHSFGMTLELHALTSVGASMAICDDVQRLVEYLGEVQPTLLCAVPRIFNKLYASIIQQIASKPRPIQKMFAVAMRGAKKIKCGGSATLTERVAMALTDKLIFSKVRRKLGGRLRCVASGSAALSKDIAEFIDQTGIKVYEGYGLSETSPLATCNYPGHRKIGSVGRTIEHVRIEIDPTADDSCTDGEIIIHGPNVMLGYKNLPEETARSLTADGGFRSGDLGRIDEDGYVYITGRIKEQYKLETGRYVAPAPIEETLKLSPFIANVLVYGDNRPFNVALIVPDSGLLQQRLNETEQTAEQIIEQELTRCSVGLKKFERIQRFLIINEDFTQKNGLLTPTLKLKRRLVIDRHRDQLERLYD
ncbi:MAG: long-chain fatty acid--CoA ligase [Patescibacteria group bacterium]